MQYGTYMIGGYARFEKITQCQCYCLWKGKVFGFRKFTKMQFPISGTGQINVESQLEVSQLMKLTLVIFHLETMFSVFASRVVTSVARSVSRNVSDKASEHVSATTAAKAAKAAKTLPNAASKTAEQIKSEAIKNAAAISKATSEASQSVGTGTSSSIPTTTASASSWKGFVQYLLVYGELFFFFVLLRISVYRNTYSVHEHGRNLTECNFHYRTTLEIPKQVQRQRISGDRSLIGESVWRPCVT